MNDPVINGIVSNFRDVTERKLHLETLLRTNDELRKTNMELDKFVYRVSHDLRAPLLSILGLIELSESEGPNTNVADYLLMMKESVQKLDGFIKDILNYSRNARSEIMQDTINLKADVAEIISQLRFINASTENIAFENSIDDKLNLICDRQRLKVIFTNLVSNAIRYRDTSIANPFIKINATEMIDKLIIHIEDNGIGISEAYQDKVFDMFFRASSRSAGTGLGLYIVKETVEKLEGSVKVVSAVGKGSTFSVTLPYKH
jgi:signal transduction histidine kinase